jgi:hypothetical protein
MQGCAVHERRSCVNPNPGSAVRSSLSLSALAARPSRVIPVRGPRGHGGPSGRDCRLSHPRDAALRSRAYWRHRRPSWQRRCLPAPKAGNRVPMATSLGDAALGSRAYRRHRRPSWQKRDHHGLDTAGPRASIARRPSREFLAHRMARLRPAAIERKCHAARGTGQKAKSRYCRSFVAEALLANVSPA